MNQPIFEKITKLLRLAERAQGPEAELALMRAQQFATGHQIDLATIDTAEGEKERKEEFLRDEVEYSERSLAVYIQWLLTNHFRVRTCYNRSEVKFVGRKSDVVFAVYLFSWLQDRFLAEWREEKSRPHEGRGRRSAKAFFYGMYQGLDEKLKKARRETEDSRLSQIATTKTPYDDSATITVNDAYNAAKTTLVAQYQLALVNEKDELEKEYLRAHPKLEIRFVFKLFSRTRNSRRSCRWRSHGTGDVSMSERTITFPDASLDVSALKASHGELLNVLRYVMAEWDSDVMSTQCFDSRIITLARLAIQSAEALKI